MTTLSLSSRLVGVSSVLVLAVSLAGCGATADQPSTVATDSAPPTTVDEAPGTDAPSAVASGVIEVAGERFEAEGACATAFDDGFTYNGGVTTDEMKFTISAVFSELEGQANGVGVSYSKASDGNALNAWNVKESIDGIPGVGAFGDVQFNIANQTASGTATFHSFRMVDGAFVELNEPGTFSITC